MAVYDCFTFYNELDLLDIRLEEMADAVDCFVLVEATTTFQGKPKPLLFHQNQRRFRRFASRVRHIVVSDVPTTNDPWTRERFQRDALKRGLFDAPDDALVLVSDVDEIIRPAAIHCAAAAARFSFFEMDMYLYYMNWRAGPWLKAYAAPASEIRSMPDLSAPRMVDSRQYLSRISAGEERIIREGGWHFSWLGGIDRMLSKFDAFSHTEETVQRWRDPTLLANEIASRRFFNDGTHLVETAVDASFPAGVRSRRRAYERAGLLTAPKRSRPNWLRPAWLARVTR